VLGAIMVEPPLRVIRRIEAGMDGIRATAKDTRERLPGVAHWLAATGAGC